MAYINTLACATSAYREPDWLTSASARAAKVIASICSAGGLQDSLARLMLPSRLPWKPGCAPEKDAFRRQVLLHQAVHEPYIELNSPAGIDWLVFDIDESTGGSCADAWIDADLPAPNIVILNPSNGHAQLIYSLETRVCTGDAARQAPQRWLEDLRTEFGARLNADLAFANCRSKNPLHSSWLTTVLREAPYSLSELAEYARPDAMRAARKARGRVREVRELGRNVEVFDRLRFWAYKAKQSFAGASFSAFHAACVSQAEKYNVQFSTPLLISEVTGIIKSISRWVWNRYGGKLTSGEDLSAVQSDLGARKGLQARSIGIPLIEGGATIEQVIQATGVSRSTAYRWKQRLKFDFAGECGEMDESVSKPSGLSSPGAEGPAGECTQGAAVQTFVDGTSQALAQEHPAARHDAESTATTSVNALAQPRRAVDLRLWLGLAARLLPWKRLSAGRQVRVLRRQAG